MHQQIIAACLARGDLSNAERLAWIAGDTRTAALFDAIDALRDEAYDEGFDQGREEGNKEGFDEGFNEGFEQGCDRAYSIATRHLKALDDALRTLDRMRGALPEGHRAEFDEALGAIETVVEELDDFDHVWRNR